MSDMLVELPWRIKRLRASHGWDQIDLALEIGVSRVTVANWERGRYVPSLESACRLADAFDVGIDVLVRGY